RPSRHHGAKMCVPSMRQAGHCRSLALKKTYQPAWAAKRFFMICRLRSSIRGASSSSFDLSKNASSPPRWSTVFRALAETRKRILRPRVSEISVTLRRFGRNRRFVLILEWLTLWPTSGLLPVRSQRHDIAKSSRTPSTKTCRFRSNRLVKMGGRIESGVRRVKPSYRMVFDGISMSSASTQVASEQRFDEIRADVVRVPGVPQLTLWPAPGQSRVMDCPASDIVRCPQSRNATGAGARKDQILRPLT